MTVDAACSPDSSTRCSTARVANGHFRIVGGGTKDFYGNALQGEPLDVRPLAGISSYEPTELVVTVRAGTPLAELEAVLAEQGPAPARSSRRGSVARGTVGGMVAAGLAGPARAAAGSVRDHVLGATLLNGKGEVLTFGGQVMKNVAGYDVSRVLAGSMGILGVICEVSLKVLPRPIATRHAALRDGPGPGAASAQRLGRPAAADQRQRLVERHARACACPARAPPSMRRDAATRRRGDRRAAGRDLLARPARPAATNSSPARPKADRQRRGVCGASACRRPLRRSRCPARQLIEWGGAQRWLCTPRPLPRCARRRQPPAATRRCSAATRQERRRLPPAVGAAGPHPPRAEEGLRPRPRLQPRPPVAGPLSADADPSRPRIQRHARRRGGRGHPAQVRALRLLHRHLPDLPAARRRARRAARAHLPDQAGARRRSADARDAAAPRPLPDLPQLRDHLPERRAVRAPGRHRPQGRRGARSSAR